MDGENGHLEYIGDKFVYVNKKSKRVILNNQNNKEIEESEVRRLDFMENVEDLSNNTKDIMEGIIDISDVCRHIETALKGDINEVIKDLNECWGYDLELWERLN